MRDALTLFCSGISGSGKSYTKDLLTFQLLKIASSQADSSSSASAAKLVPKLSEQVKAAQTLLDAFGSAKTAITGNATRQGRVLELHFKSEGSLKSILSGAKVLTFGFDHSRLQAPLRKDERSFHVFYWLLAGTTPQEQREYKLLQEPSEYELLASSACYRLPADQSTTDEFSFNGLKAAFTTLGFKPRHIEMIYKLLSAILLLGNVHFSDGVQDSLTRQDSVTISPESRPAFSNICTLLGLQEDDLERALVNKTTYIRKEVVCALLTNERAIKQRDSLMSALYAILFSYMVESINHRLFPGDEAIRKMQRVNDGNSIVLLDMPGFQTNSATGGLASGAATRDSDGSFWRKSLIQAYGEDGFEHFLANFASELLQHWQTRRTFNDDACDFSKRCVGDGITLPGVDVLDTSAITLELLRGGILGSRADTRPTGLLGGLIKTCHNFRKGKIVTEEAADAAFIEGMEERFSLHSRYIPRVAGRQSSFAVKHYISTVSYTSKNFIEKDLDLLDSEFVRLFRTSSTEPLFAKLFSGPSLAIETHPRDSSVLVAAQVSLQPLRRLSPLKVCKTSSTSVPLDYPEPDIAPVTSQLNETITGLLTALNDVPVWTVSCIRPNNNGLPGVLDIRGIKRQIEAMNLPSTISRKRIDYVESHDFAEIGKRYAPVGLKEEADAESVTDFFRQRGFERDNDFAIGQSTVWLTFNAWRSLEGLLRAVEVEEAQSINLAEPRINSKPNLESRAGNNPAMLNMAFGEARDSMLTLGPDRDGKGGSYGESSEDLLKRNMEEEGGAYEIPYDAAFAAFPEPNLLRQNQMSYHPSVTPGLPREMSNFWGPDFKQYSPANSQPTLPSLKGPIDEKVVSPTIGAKKVTMVEEIPTSGARRAWLILVWSLTWWIPSFLLSYVGRMKRPDVRIAWREKVALCMLIFLVCGSLVRCLIQMRNWSLR